MKVSTSESQIYDLRPDFYYENCENMNPSPAAQICRYGRSWRELRVFWVWSLGATILLISETKYDILSH